MYHYLVTCYETILLAICCLLFYGMPRNEVGLCPLLLLQLGIDFPAISNRSKALSFVINAKLHLALTLLNVIQASAERLSDNAVLFYDQVACDRYLTTQQLLTHSDPYHRLHRHLPYTLPTGV
jgi:hypothetical protein